MFLLKQISLSSKCEICHQKDCFNAKKNFCSRCADFDSEVTPIPKRVAKYNLANIGTLLGILVGLSLLLVIMLVTGKEIKEAFYVGLGFAIWGAILGSVVGEGLMKL
ncbi:MAG: hypothetical protein IPK14_05065 [Blastocatellia bacterium]|nr:hypothetical protein [Blastocatellia bacterium]MBL8195984.1 hypothetical protein [Blastocatellia bacterium]MBN8723258.1 hypothetical protein [Acidobacteriota bacterium]